MPRCRKCNEIMRTDIENRRYVCDSCGYEIIWVTRRRENGEETIYA